MADRRSPVEVLRLYGRIVGASARSQMQYRVSFFSDVVANFAYALADLATILIMFTHTPALKGWSLAETGLLFGVASTSLALGEMFGGGFDWFDLRIREGRFDSVLVRPLGSFFQVMAEEFVLRRFGRLGQGLAVIVIASRAVGLDPANAIFLLPVLVGGCLFFMALNVAKATVAFWTVQSLEMFNILTNGGCDVLSHPIEIYHDWIQKLFLFVLPMAFISHIPIGVMLGKPVPVPVWMAWLSPLVGLAAFLASRQFWKAGIRHYTGTGS